jgi:integrase/recombinase XerD
MENGGKPRFLEPHEVQRLLEAPNLRSLTGLRNRCVLQLMYEAGLRISEVPALKPCDVVLKDKRT